MAARLTAYVVVAIVAATLIAGLIVGAQRDDSEGPVDLIVRNATVYTADRRGTIAEAVAVRGNQILRVGSNREIARFERPQTVVVDARGGTVLPGFNDSHLDLIAGGLRLDMADLAGAATTAEVLERIRTWRASNPGARWVVGTGWTPDQFRNGQPTRQLLDAVVEDRPAIMFSADEKTTSVWANSTALRAATLTRNSEDPAGGSIVREPRTGEPSGLLHGSAATRLAELIPRPSRAERIEALRTAILQANAHGITSAQNTADSCEADLDLYDEIKRAGNMTLRVYCATSVEAAAIKSEADLVRYEEVRTRFPDDPLFKTGALSFTLDGPISSRAAALLQPYAAGEATGAALVDADELNRAVRLADAAGWQVVAQANGDAAVRMALDAYAHASRSNRPPARGRRHRVEHVAMVDPADVPRFGRLGVAASMQPPLLGTGGTAWEMLSKTIGVERATRLFPLNELAAQTRLLLGSGWPGDTLDPLELLDRAVNGAPPTGAEAAAASAPVMLKIKPAIEAYTSAAAWGSFDDQRKGSLSPGMLADLVVLSEDVLATPARLSKARVVATIFDGRIVYRRGGPSLTEPAPSLQH